MKNLFQEDIIKETDDFLISQILRGDKNALELLIKKHQNFIYNVALAMVSDSNDAADITQEVLIKVMTKVGTFKRESNFRTWVYRIVKNHFLNTKRRKYEIVPISFDAFGTELDTIPDELIEKHNYNIDKKIIIEETKIACMKGMLLCLDREQRFIYIIGELFEFTDTIGSEIMEISKGNFRIKLHRAKTQLYNFMNNKCGLVNKANPCRCARKTAGFIKKGYVDPVNLYFQKEKITTISNLVSQKVKDFDNSVLEDFQQLFQKHPYVKSPDRLKSVKELLSSKSIKDIFELE